jgi:AcrR family transcriptional regulator
MEDIAHAAGYGKSTLYEYFGGKDEIFSELMRVKFVERYRLIAKNSDRESTPAGKLRAFLVGEMDMMLEYGGKERLEGIIMSNPETVLSSEFKHTVNKIVMFKFEHVSGYIQEGVKDGSFLNTDPYIASAIVIGSSMAFLGTINSPVYKQATKSKGSSDEDRLNVYFDLIFRALRR